MQFRQGDVFIEAISAIPEGARRKRRARKILGQREPIVLALGEATGHAHIITEDEVVLYEGDDGQIYIDVKKPARVEHQEHGPIDLPVGKYAVNRQREYDPVEGFRQVLD